MTDLDIAASRGPGQRPGQRAEQAGIPAETRRFAPGTTPARGRCMSIARTALASFALLSVVSTCGCNQQDDEEDLAIASTSSALSAAHGSGLGHIALEHLDVSLLADPETACRSGAAIPPTMLYPASCVTKTCTGQRMHIELSDCTGPAGKKHLTGGIDATFARKDGGGLAVTLADSGNLPGNGRPIDYKASADVADGGAGQLAITWTARWSGHTKRGRAIEHTSTLNVVADKATSCLDIVGTISGDVGPVDVAGTIDGLAICPGKCPTAGVVNITKSKRLRSRTMSISFDGSDKAHVQSDKRGAFDVDLVCDADDLADQTN